MRLAADKLKRFDGFRRARNHGDYKRDPPEERVVIECIAAAVEWPDRGSHPHVCDP